MFSGKGLKPQRKPSCQSNRNALIRYKTIDLSLQNRYRRWTLKDLVEACSEALYEYEGIDKGVSVRSVQADIQMMRSDKLGYNAPIIVVDRKYYTYEDPEYSITNMPLTEQDLGRLSEAVEFMKQFQGFSHFQELGGMVQKLEDHIYSSKTHSRPVIDFEKNENLRGIEHLDQLYQAILKQQALKLTYQNFKARAARSFIFHPYLLKEFRNRWFLLGRETDGKMIVNLALDRILSIEQGDAPFQPAAEPVSADYFRDVIGASVSQGAPVLPVKLWLSHKGAPYILTKPLHHSQKVISRDAIGVTIELRVQHNFELEKDLLALGEQVKVLGPEKLKARIRERHQAALERYQTEISPKGMRDALARLQHRGFAILHPVFASRELRKIGQYIDRHVLKKGQPAHARRRLLVDFPHLKGLLLTPNFRRIVHAIDPNAFICRAMYFDKPPEANWFVTWHQDVAIGVAERLDQPGFTGWTLKDKAHSVNPPLEIAANRFAIRIHLDATDEHNGALRVLPGSHKKVLTDAEIALISENGHAQVCAIGAGGVHLLHPLMLHASAKSTAQKRRRVIHLEFSSQELPHGLEWAERSEMPLLGEWAKDDSSPPPKA